MRIIYIINSLKDRADNASIYSIVILNDTGVTNWYVMLTVNHVLHTHLLYTSRVRCGPVVPNKRFQYL